MESLFLELIPGRKVTVVLPLKSSICLLQSVCLPDENKTANLLVHLESSRPICVARLSSCSHQSLNIPLSNKVDLEAVGGTLSLLGTRSTCVEMFPTPAEPLTGILKRPNGEAKKPHGRSVTFSNKVERSLGDGLIYEVLKRGRSMAVCAAPGKWQWRFRILGQTDELVARLGFQKDCCQGLDLALRGMQCGEIRRIQLPAGLDSPKTPMGEYTVEFLGPAGSAKKMSKL